MLSFVHALYFMLPYTQLLNRRTRCITPARLPSSGTAALPDQSLPLRPRCPLSPEPPSSRIAADITPAANDGVNSRPITLSVPRRVSSCHVPIGNLNAVAMRCSRLRNPVNNPVV